jgi:hypothetical protein
MIGEVDEVDDTNEVDGLPTRGIVGRVEQVVNSTKIVTMGHAISGSRAGM